MIKSQNPETCREDPEPGIPADLREALAATPLAEAAWWALTQVARHDYTRWIETAKQAETRARRIERTCESIAAGKRRPCCYAVVPFEFYKAYASDPVAKANWNRLGSMERRDLVSWIEEAVGKEAFKRRIDEACAMLVEGLDVKAELLKRKREE